MRSLTCVKLEPLASLIRRPRALSPATSDSDTVPGIGGSNMAEPTIVLALVGILFMSGFWAGYALRDRQSRLRRQRFASVR